MTSNADFKRRVRERMARTGESYAAARAQLLPKTTLHVTNGDITVALLAQIGVEAMAWRDSLHEGPVVPGGRALRAEFLGVDGREFEDATARSTRTPATTSCGSRPTSTTSSRSPRSSRGSGTSTRRASRCVRSASTSASRISGGSASSSPSSCEALPEIALSADALELGVRAWEALIAPEPTRPALACTAHPSCASWPRPSSALRRSTRGGVTGSRSASDGCWRRTPGTQVRAVRAGLAQGGAPVPRRHVGIRPARPARPAAAPRGRRAAPERRRRASARGRDAST